MKKYYNTDHITYTDKEQYVIWVNEQGLKFNEDWGWSLFDGIWFDGIWFEGEEDATAFRLRFKSCQLK